jgi:hypothetical protein
MNWINLAQDRDQWRTLVNTLMDLRGPIKCRKIYCRHRLLLAAETRSVHAVMKRCVNASIHGDKLLSVMTPCSLVGEYQHFE